MAPELPRRKLTDSLDSIIGTLRESGGVVVEDLLPPDIARTLPRRVQELLGYAAHDAIADAGGYLGALDLLESGEI